MSVLSCSKKLVSSAFKSSGLLEQTGVFRSVCSVTKARCHSRCFTTNVALSRCRLWHHAFNRPLGKTRLFSKLCAESSNSKRSTAVFPEESQEMDTDSSQKFSEKFTLDVLVSLLHQENAVDICVIKVPEQIKYAEYFIVVSGASPRHLRAMALYAIKVYKFLKKDGELNAKIEGKDAEDWMCIDFGNMVVHFMLPETREVYELEKLWTLRAFDEQLQSIPAETLPEDFIYDAEVTK